MAVFWNLETVQILHFKMSLETPNWGYFGLWKKPCWLLVLVKTAVAFLSHYFHYSSSLMLHREMQNFRTSDPPNRVQRSPKQVVQDGAVFLTLRAAFRWLFTINFWTSWGGLWCSCGSDCVGKEKSTDLSEARWAGQRAPIYFLVVFVSFLLYFQNTSLQLTQRLPYISITPLKKDPLSQHNAMKWKGMSIHHSPTQPSKERSVHLLGNLNRPFSSDFRSEFIGATFVSTSPL